jgi:hypothetical protein
MYTALSSHGDDAVESIELPDDLPVNEAGLSLADYTQLFETALFANPGATMKFTTETEFTGNIVVPNFAAANVTAVDISPNTGPVGTIFTVSATVTGYPTPTISRQWVLNGTPISGQIAGNYVSTTETTDLTCIVSAENSISGGIPDTLESDPVIVTGVAGPLYIGGTGLFNDTGATIASGYTMALPGTGPNGAPQAGDNVWVVYCHGQAVGNDSNFPTNMGLATAAVEKISTTGGNNYRGEILWKAALTGTDISNGFIAIPQALPANRCTVLFVTRGAAAIIAASPNFTRTMTSDSDDLDANQLAIPRPTATKEATAIAIIWGNRGNRTMTPPGSWVTRIFAIDDADTTNAQYWLYIGTLEMEDAGQVPVSNFVLSGAANMSITGVTLVLQTL